RRRCQAGPVNRRFRRRGATHVREPGCNSCPGYASILGASVSSLLSISSVPITPKARELQPSLRLDPNNEIPSSKTQPERVSDVMTRRVIQAIGPHATVAEAAKKM